MARKFVYDGKDFPDPDPTKTPEEVKQLMVDFYPELANADIKETKQGEDTYYEFQRRIGTKG